MEAGGGVVGAIGGAGLGVLAGPPGVAAGAVIGAAAGTLAAWAMDAENAEAAAIDRELDREIGVDGGDIGVADANQAEGTVNAPSLEAAGASNARSDDTISSEGPITPPPGER